MTDDKITIFAETNFRNQSRRFGIKTSDRRRHMYVIGKTGMGKSTLLSNMIIRDIQAGRGVAIVDPHGDLAEEVLDYIPSSRINDVVYFNPADVDYPLAFNVLENIDSSHQHLISSGLVGVFKKMFAESWGPRLEYLLRNAVLALLDYPGSTLLGIMRILVDKSYRKKVIDKIKDPVVKSFWIDEYSKYPDRFQTEAIAPIQNKVGQFLSISLIRNIVGQVKSTINMREIMDNEKILILNLAKGRIGEDASALFGAMMITKIQLAAMERVDIPKEERKDFYLYVDEFQNFATESFATILSEARKYHLNLTIAHQYIEQLDETVQAAVFGNVGTIICFRIGAIDAEVLVKEFTPRFTEEDLVNLTKYEFYLKLMIDGVSSDAFSARGLPPISGFGEGNMREKIIKVSRERYGNPRKVIEEKIIRWTGVESSSKDLIQAAQRPAVEPRRDFRNTNFRPSFPKERINKPSYQYNAVCQECNREIKIFFQPDGVRPVYCKDCLKKNKDLKRHQNHPRSVFSRQLNERQETPGISLAEAMKVKPIAFQHKSKKNKKKNKPFPTAKPQEFQEKLKEAPQNLAPGQVVQLKN